MSSLRCKDVAPEERDSLISAFSLRLSERGFITAMTTEQVLPSWPSGPPASLLQSNCMQQVQAHCSTCAAIGSRIYSGSRSSVIISSDGKVWAAAVCSRRPLCTCPMYANAFWHVLKIIMA